MANSGIFVAGQAKILLSPSLVGFTQKLKTALKPIRGEVTVGLVPSTAGLAQKVNTELAKINTNPLRVSVVPNMAGFRQRLRDELKAVDAKVDVQANLSLDLTQAHAQLNAFRALVTANPLRMRVDLDTTGAHAQLAALAAHMLALNVANTTSITITGIGSAASSALNPVSLLAGGLVALGAVSLIPLVGQLAQAAGVLALIPAAASAAVIGIGTLVVGLSGIKNAFDAVKKASADNGKSAAAAQKKIDSAIRGTSTAQKGLASAQKAASRTAVDGQRQIASAQKTYNQALKREQDAQKDLSRARKDAAKQLEDLGRQLRGGVLDERDAELAVREAEQRLREIGSDGPVSQIEIERAVLNVDQAKNQLEETRARNRELRDESGKAAQAGVEGSELVQDAQERVTEAAENTKDAEQNLARTREDATQANIDAQDRIVEAQQQVVESQEALNDAIASGDSVAKELEDALSKLAPSARDFVTKVQTLGSAWTDFRKNVQEKLFFGLGDSVVDLGNTFLPMLKSDIGDIAAEINGGLKRAFADLASDENVSTFGKIFENVRQSIGPLIDGLNDMFVAFLNLSGVGSEFLPGLSTGFAGSMEDFRKWTEDPDNQGKFRTFIEEALRTFGVLAEIVKEIGEIGWNLFAASDDTGESMIDGILKKLIEFSDWVKSPEGQKSIKEFFEDVKNLVVEIGTAIEKTLGLLKEVNDADLGGIGKRVGGLGKSAAENAGKDFTTGGPIFSKVTDPLLEKFTGVPTEAGKNYIFSKQFFKDAATDYAQWGIDMKAKTEEIWSGIGGTIGGWVTNIKDNAFEDFQTGLSGVQGFFSENVPKIGGFFGELKTTIGTSLDNVVTFFTELPGRIATAASGMWDGIANSFKAMLNQVISWWNNLELGWDKIEVKFGPDIPAFKLNMPDIPMLLAGGGKVVGEGTGTSDSIFAKLSNGEFVMPAAATAKNLPMLEALRAGWVPSAGLLSAMTGIQGYAGGGLVTDDEKARMGGGTVNLSLWEAIKSQVPDAQLNSAKTDHDVDSGLHPKGQAIDVAPNSRVLDLLWSNRHQLAQIIFDDPEKVWLNNNGEKLEGAAARAKYGAATMAQHADHIHVGAHSAVTFGGQAPGISGPDTRTAKQRNVDTVIAEGRRLGASDKQIKAAVMTILAEADGEDLAHGDRDSEGAFQQRPSQGWGPASEDLSTDARQFFEALMEVPGQETMSEAQLAQSVQKSAFSDGSNYAARSGEADQLIAESGSRGLGSASAPTSTGAVQNVFVTNWPALGGVANAITTSDMGTLGTIPGTTATPTPLGMGGPASGADTTQGSIFNLGKGGPLPWYLTGENAGPNLAGQAAALAGTQVQGLGDYAAGNWKEMLSTAVGAIGMGAANSGVSGMTINGNVGYTPSQLRHVYERNINRQVRAARFNSRGIGR